MARILILIGGHICMAPRPHKEAETLANAGHDVTVVGIWYDDLLVERDRHLMYGKNWRYRSAIDFRNRKHKIKTRGELFAAKILFGWFGIIAPELLGYGVKALLKIARETKADLTIVHSEVGLWVGCELVKQKFNVGVDFEDWFSEDLLPEDRNYRPTKYLKTLEAYLIRKCSYSLTTSYALSEALAATYNARKPDVILNVFPWKEREYIDGKSLDRRGSNVKSLHWFSQTIGPGRGLETLFNAIQYVSTPVEIHLRGNCYKRYEKWLESLIPALWRNRTFIHKTVPNDQLLSRIAEHDIGLALESPEVISRDLTVTNKYFQYLLAGLGIIATDTTGQREIFSQCPETGILIPCNNSVALANAINELINNSEKLTRAKSASLQATRNIFNWEKQREIILHAADKALAK